MKTPVLERKVRTQEGEALRPSACDGLEEHLTIVSLQNHAEAVRQKELARLRSKLKTLTPEKEDAVNTLTASLVKELLPTPIRELRNYAPGEGALTYLHVVRTRFHLDD
ncbi:MAG: hypothetical protein ACE5JS_14165 [Nitrospinota bacterium]